MNREEALQQFFKEHGDTLVKKAKKDLYENLRQHKDEFSKKLCEGINQLTDKVVLGEEETKFAFIQISYLRTSVIDGTYVWYVEAQDNRGSLDLSDRHITVELKSFFEPLEQLRQELIRESYAYNGMVTEFDIEQTLCKVFDFFVPMFFYLGCYAVEDVTELEGYQKLPKEPLFRIVFGEYKGKGSILHITNAMIEKDEAFWNNLFSPVKENGFTDREFSYQDYRGMAFREECIAYKNLRYSNLKGVFMEEQHVTACNLMGANCKDMVIKDCNLNFDVCIDADFRGVQISDTTFWSCRFEDGTLTDEIPTPGVGGVRFDGAVLSRVNFSQSCLKGAHFENATLDDVTFPDVDLTDAVFSKEMEQKLTLTKEQRRVVHFV